MLKNGLVFVCNMSASLSGMLPPFIYDFLFGYVFACKNVSTHHFMILFTLFLFMFLIIFVAVLPEPACLVCLIRLPYINPPPPTNARTGMTLSVPLVRSCGFVPDGYHSHLTRRLPPSRWCCQGKCERKKSTPPTMSGRVGVGVELF